MVPLGKYFKEINALLKYEMEDKECCLLKDICLVSVNSQLGLDIKINVLISGLNWLYVVVWEYVWWGYSKDIAK